MAQDHVGKSFEFRATPHPAGGIVRVADHQDLGGRRDDGLEVIEVDLVPIRAGDEGIVLALEACR